MLMPQKIKVLLVDDHPLVREWLANLLNRQSDFQVCGEATNGWQAIELMATAKPDVAIVDISLEGGSGIELIRTIKCAHPKVVTIVLSMHDESLFAERALRAGARGYVMKRQATKNIIAAIRTAIEGRLYLTEEFKASITRRQVERNDVGGPPVDRLSARELEVFRMLGRGLKTRRIAEAMKISLKTVQVFSARIKEKLMLTKRIELLREAVLWHENSGRIDDKTQEPTHPELSRPADVGEAGLE
jgi:DNA-binding NarL/FixJ family response regulator